MKQILPLFLLGAGLTLGGALNAQAQDVKAGTITSQSADTKANAVNVTLTGALTSTANGDFRQLRDLCWQMRSLNLQMASVTAIPDNALHSRHRLHELVLPNKLLTIGRQAFFACDSLEGTLVIPDKVTVVGPSAFNGCRSLTGLKLSKAMVSLGSYAFAGCTSLEGEVNLPESMLTLRDGVFARCSSLQRVTLPTSLQRIGANAFSGCSSLEGDIVMGRMLTHIGASAFAGCSKLQTLSLPRALQQVGEGAFADCSALTGRVSLPASVQDLGLGAFQGCSGIEEVVLPESLAQVKAATFAGCTGLKSVTVYAATPPAADATAFAGVDTKEVKLCVPEEYKEAYAEAPVWKDFQLTALTAIDQAAATAQVKLAVEGSHLWVKHLPQASQVKLYNAQGQLVASVRAEGEVSLLLPQRGVYVVTVNGKNFKIKH